MLQLSEGFAELMLCELFMLMFSIIFFFFFIHLVWLERKKARIEIHEIPRKQLLRNYKVFKTMQFL